MARRVFHGALSDGTNTIAELMAYLLPLTWYAALVSKEPERIRHIHIITDNQHLSSTGEGGQLRDKNIVFWSAFKMFERTGFKLHWHWVGRDILVLNRLADAVSRAARLQYKAANPVQTAAQEGLTSETAEPWE
jgi:ribonuclease HI